MKNFFKNVLMVGLFSVLVFSCGEDEERRIDSSDIVGTWEIEDFNVSLSINGKSFFDFLVEDAGLSIEDAQTFDDAIANDFFEPEDLESTRLIFNANGTYQVWQNDTLDEEGVYEVNSSDKTLTLKDSPSDQEGVTFNIEQLNSTSLKLSLEESEEFDMTEDGGANQLMFKLTMNFSRV
ncbi:lipocalin family protein [Belliella kenyensis]|uniref:Lipocalin family protein n=1 Tax=Belliella kenyensis TaxID=1472724 RepID=A0ABV8ENZ2_9BACT|nr:lipocalin family protein [Belliella kenyensis]MCH7403779.1 copper resistance protein NlpE [Belliella kenyensis]MDN3602437.1 lipocalin family protein [Belliella kenyensis]